MIRTPRARLVATALLLAGTAISQAGTDAPERPITKADCGSISERSETKDTHAPSVDAETLGGFSRNLRRVAAEARDLCGESDDENE